MGKVDFLGDKSRGEAKDEIEGQTGRVRKRQDGITDQLKRYCR